MNSRPSIEIEGFSHGAQPIPAASRVGPLVMTGGVQGMDPASGKLPDDVEEQTRLKFDNPRRIMATGRGGLELVAKMTVFVKVPEARAAVKEEWLKASPDPGSRPSRHTLINEALPGNMVVQCDATAWVG